MPTVIRRAVLALAAAALVLGVGVPQAGAAGATIRPISDWVDAQTPDLDPSRDILDWQIIFWSGQMRGQIQPEPWALVVGDYAGAIARWIEANDGPDLSPQISGQIVERPLADGRAMVEVQLTARNAVVYGFTTPDWPAREMLLGAQPEEVVAGADPALGTVSVKITFINTAPGAPMPDWLALAVEPLAGQEEVRNSVSVSAVGPLGAATGYPVGTPGRISTVQSWLGHVPVAVPPGTTADGFPREYVFVSAIGH